MALAPGTRLGRYEITAFVAAGGMGEVYRATDTGLRRSVAIKVLAAVDRTRTDAVHRFEQEARSAAALSHPNILAVYDVGSYDGTPYIVSELLDGQTLRDALGGRPLPARKAVDYAVQIAHGLAAAHAAGIVHRDLKPENVFVTTDGRIKIVDFGLAKLLTTSAAAGTAASAVTVVPHDTAPGLLLGTVTYMSPEQVRGQPADARSDVFALGAMLYEMLSGRRAFARETPADTMTAILGEEPPELSAGEVSPALTRIVRHCLEKLPDQRFQSARDLAFDLEALSDASGVTTARAAAARSRRRVPAWALVPALVAGALVAWAGLSMRPRAALNVPFYQQLTFQQGMITNARFTADGRSVVYGATWGRSPLDVYAIELGSVESRSLGLPGADLLSSGVDGSLAISLRRAHTEGFTFTGMLARVPLGGSGPRELLENVEWADWSPDGAAMAVIREVGGRTRLEYPIGTVLVQTAGWLSDVRISPRGDQIAYIDHPFRRNDAGSVNVVDRSGHVKQLADDWLSVVGLAWSGSDLWFTASKEGNNRALYSVSPGGVVRPLAGSPGLITLHDVSADGRALLTRDTTRLDTMVSGPGATAERDISWLDWTRLRDITADGRTILFDETGQGGGPREGVFIRNIDGSPAIRLGDGTGESFSPDGRWVISVSVDRIRLVLLPTGPGESRTVATAPIEHLHRAYWMPDGKRLLLAANEKGHGARFWIVDLAGGPPRAVTPEGTSVDGAISPDGRWLATRIGSAATIFPLDGGSPRTVNGVAPSEILSRWTPDAAGLYVYDPTRMPVPLVRVDVATGAREVVREIAASSASPLWGIQYLFVTPDLKEYAYTTLHWNSELFVVNGLGK